MGFPITRLAEIWLVLASTHSICRISYARIPLTFRFLSSHLICQSYAVVSKFLTNEFVFIDYVESVFNIPLKE